MVSILIPEPDFMYRSDVLSTNPPPRSPEMIRAEARVWADYMKPLEELVGDRSIADVGSDPRVQTALDEIDFAALREFLEIVGGRATRVS